MSETLAGPPNAEQQLADVLATHGQVQIGPEGKTMSVEEYYIMGKILCPHDVSQMTASEILGNIVPKVAEKGVELSEDLMAYMPQPEVAAHTTNKAENSLTPKVITEKGTTVKTVTNNLTIKNNLLEVETVSPQEKIITAPINRTLLLAQVLEREIILDIIKPTKPVPENKVVLELAEQPILLRPSFVFNENTVSKKAQKNISKNTTFITAEVTSAELTTESELSESLITTNYGASSIPEYNDKVFEPLVNIVETAVNVEDPPVLTLLEVPLVTEVESLEQVMYTPEPLTEAEQLVATVESFFEQIAPLVSEQIGVRLAEMPPEEAAEIVAQVEMLIVVADRLHLLITEGNELGEEAQQIEAFLSREYEQLLIKVGIEPTPEMIAQFIRYIHSDSYDFAAAMANSKFEDTTADEGTHEKKLFDEAGVFSKAQQASALWKQNLQTMIGRVTINNLAA